MSSTRKLGITLLGILAATFLAVWLRNQQQIQRLPDGSSLSLHHVKFGFTNEFVHGAKLEKLLGRIIPAKGLKVWKFSLSRPTKHVSYLSSEVSGLSAEFRLIPTKENTSIVSRPAFPRTLRWVVTAEDDIPYIQEFRDWTQQKDGLFTGFGTSLFPRQKRQLWIDLEEHDEGTGGWNRLARFHVKNPVTSRARSWTPPPGPTTMHVDDMEFTLGETAFSLTPWNTNDIWSCHVSLPFQVKRHGTVETNWSADYFILEDASGNRDRFGALKTTTNGWLIYETWRSPDPNYVWRINVDFGLDSGWSPTNVFTIKLAIPWNGPTKTNFNGIPVEIDFVNGDMLAVNIPTNRTDLRLTFVGANDGGGPFRTGSWSQHRFWKELQLPPSGGMIEATFAVDRNYHLEFSTRPVWLNSGATDTDLKPGPIQPHL